MPFYYQCCNFWSTSFGLCEDDSIKLAIKDCEHITHVPWSPKGPLVPEDVKQKWIASIKDNFYNRPISLAGVKKIQEKLPHSLFWKQYKERYY